MRPCLLASKAACRTGTGSSGRYHAFLGLNSSRCACSAAGSDSKQTSTWEQDLAEVLREPQVSISVLKHVSACLRVRPAGSHVQYLSSFATLQADFERERADKPLQAWQLQKLQAAAATGRRKVKVSMIHRKSLRQVQQSLHPQLFPQCIGSSHAAHFQKRTYEASSIILKLSSSMQYAYTCT